jgi:putative CocE/NonD family hydrolase
MTPMTLFILILVQIAVFQVVAIRMSDSMVGALIGGDPLPESTARRMASFRKRMKREHLILAAALGLLAVLGIVFPSLPRGGRKLVLAGVSLASTALFLVLLVRDGRAVTKIANDLPEPGQRAASLERRSLRRFYSPWLEAIPFLILGATVGLTAALLPAGRAGLDASTGEKLLTVRELRAWIAPILQATWVVAMLAVTLYQVRGSGCLRLKRRAADRDPLQTVEMDQRLRDLQIRHGFVSKTLVTALIGVVHLRRVVLSATDVHLPALAVLEWVLVAGMLVLFAGYMFSLTHLQRGRAGRSASRGPGGAEAGALIAILVGLCATAPAATQAAASPDLATVQGAMADTAVPRAPLLSGHADEGVYRFYLNEEVLVTQHFVWKDDGAYEGEYTITTAVGAVTTRMKIATDGAGDWQGIEMETPLGPVTVAREDSIARITHEDKVATVALKPGTILFENFNPALMQLALEAYDETKGGKQEFPLFIIPHVVMQGSLERQDVVERSVGERDLALTRYVYGLPGVDVTLYVDPQGRIVFGDVPAQHGAYVREGYEALRRPAEADSLISRPAYEVDLASNVRIPMRDGIELATDIYRPRTEERVPVILVRTPYKKEMNDLQARFFARRGYAYAVQDCRGRFSSAGEWEPFFHEAHDGYDAIEWLAAQPWSTGKIGMIGASYVGWVQWWAARDRPPHLVTIIPNVSPPDPFLNIPYEYGCFFLMGAIWWADILESEATGDLSGAAFMRISEKKYARLLRDLPVIDLDRKVLGKENPYWRQWIEHPVNDAYWEPANFLDHLEPLDIPVFHQSGWFDGDGIGSKLNYLGMVSHGHPYQKLVLGPWGHTDVATRRIGDRDFGEAAILDLQRDYLRWLDRWLKGIENGIDREPLVSIFTMGSNRWLKGDVYPLRETRMTKLYLTSGGSANTSAGDGRLTWALPGAACPPDHFVYDPDDPTPSPSFYVAPEDLAAEEGDADSAAVKSIEREREKQKAYHAQVDAARADILVYDTAPLDEPLTIAGPVSAVLYAASSARDTDWFVRLAEVTADGEIFALVEGKIRARFRRSLSRPELLEPGAVEEYTIDLWQTGITIPAGSRLRVEVASASFPVFSRNLNTGGHSETETEFVKAEQTIYHDPEHPSHVLLPVIPEGK